MLIFAIAGFVSAARAEVRPHSLFGDNMVLQQGMKITVWGKADPGERVTVKIQDQEGSGAADKDGKWRVELGALKAGGPFELRINEQSLKNVLVGAVWVGSGQSNMEWSMNATRDAKKNIAEANYPEIRLFRTPKSMQAKPLSEFAPSKNPAEGKWQACTPENVAGFSAVQYYFGRKLHLDRKTPVGLIQAAWGGTAAELWTRADIFDMYPELKGLKGSQLYNGMIAPLLPFAIKGVIWYQGESNVGNAWQYRTLFPAMIKNWRDDWKQGDFPFLFVQIAAFKPYNSERSPVLREAQLYTAQTVPNSAMVVITDYGDEGDIHPVDKDPVGVRLALCAQALAYKEKVPHSGPEFTRQKIEGTKIVLSFKNADVLVAKELEIPRTLAELGEKNGKKVVLKRYQSPIQVKAGELPGFTIAGKDGKFFEAQAKIIGGQIEVSSAQVSEPVAVRYGWSDSPVINLFNGAGLPASPFRTDVFKVPSQP